MFINLILKDNMRNSLARLGIKNLYNYLMRDIIINNFINPCT